MISNNRFRRVLALLLLCSLCAGIAIFKVRRLAEAQQEAFRDFDVAIQDPPPKSGNVPVPEDPFVPAADRITDSDPAAETKTPAPKVGPPADPIDAINQLAKSVVTIARVYPQTEGQAVPDTKLQAGIIIDPRGYIVTVSFDNDAGNAAAGNANDDPPDPQFVVRFSNQNTQECIAQVIENDRLWNLAILKIDTIEPVQAISLKNVPSPVANGKVLVVPSRPRKTRYSGRITKPSIRRDRSAPYGVIESNVVMPAGAYEWGSLIISSRHEPIGILSQQSFGESRCVIPLKAVLKFIDSDETLQRLFGDRNPDGPPHLGTVQGDSDSDVGKKTAPTFKAPAVGNPQLAGADDILKQLAKSVVTIAKVARPAVDSPAAGPSKPDKRIQAGVVIDPRGYIVTPWINEVDDGKETDDEHLVVRFSNQNQQEYPAEVVENDRLWGLALLRIRANESLPSISMKNAKQLQIGGAAQLVASVPQKDPVKGRITSTEITSTKLSLYKLIESNMEKPAGETGSLVVTSRGIPIGILSSEPYIRPSYIIPMQAVLSFIASDEVLQEQLGLDDPNRAPALDDDAHPPFRTSLARGYKVPKLGEPDISGTWSNGNRKVQRKLVVRRDENKAAEFTLDNGVQAGQVKWSPEAELFEGTLTGFVDKLAARIAMEVLPDGNTMRFRLLSLERWEKKLKKTQIEAFAQYIRQEFVDQDWIRVQAPGRSDPDESDDELTGSSRKRIPAIGEQDNPGEGSTDFPATDGPAVRPFTNSPAGSNTVAAADESSVPDISGEWFTVDPVAKGEIVFRRIEDKPGEYVSAPEGTSVKWSPETRRFEGEFIDPTGLSGIAGKIAIEVFSNGSLFRYRVLTLEDTGRKYTQEEIAEITKIIEQGTWSRTAPDRGPKRPARKSDGASRSERPGFNPVPTRIPDDGLTEGLRSRPQPTYSPGPGGNVYSSMPTSAPPVAPARQFRAVTDSPAEQKLIAELQARESAAAELAAKIRRLQAEGPVERNRPALREAQGQLGDELGKAFDLKLQLEELQVKELQARLSRLEQRIGQRRALRDKVISHRAGELLEENGLQWDTSSTSGAGPPPGNPISKRPTPTLAVSPAVIEKLHKRALLLLEGLKSGQVKPAAVLSALRDLAQAGAEPNPHWIQALLNVTRQLHMAEQITEAELLEIEAACSLMVPVRDEASLKPITGTATPQDANVSPAKPGVTKFRMSGTKGMHISIEGLEKNLGMDEMIAIRRLAGEVRQMPFRVQSAPGSRVYVSGRLGVYPIDRNDPKADAFLQNIAVPFQISEQDTRMVAGDVDVTKLVVMRFVVRLSDKKVEEIQLETLDSTTLPPGTDLIEEGSRRGTIVAVLSLSRRFAASREPGDQTKRGSDKPPIPSEDPFGIRPSTGDPDIANDRPIARPGPDPATPTKPGRGMMKPGVTQIRIRAPEGMQVSIAGEKQDSTMFGCYYIKHPVAQMRRLPALVQFAPGSEFYTSGELQLYPSERFVKKHPGFSSYLENHAVEFQISEQDTRSVWEGNEVTKVIVIRDLVVLKDPEQEFELETIDSATFPPGTRINEIYQEANQRGTILAMLRLTRGVLPEGASDLSVTPLDPPEVQTPTENSPLKRIREFSVGEKINRIACSTDGKLIAVGNSYPAEVAADGKMPVVKGWKPTVVILDGETGKTVASLNLIADEKEADVLALTKRVPIYEVNAIAFSPDGNTVAVGTDAGQVKLFRTRTGALIRSLDDKNGSSLGDVKGMAANQKPDPLKSLTRALGRVNSLAFSPDGSLLATCGQSFEDDPLMRDAVRPVPRGGLAGNSGMGRMAGGKMDAAGDSNPGRLKVWDVNAGTVERELGGMQEALDVAFSPDGNLLACAGNWLGGRKVANGFETGVMLWQLNPDAPRFHIACTEYGLPRSIAFSPNSQNIAICAKSEGSAGQSLILANVAPGAPIWSKTIPWLSREIAFSPHGNNLIATTDYNVPLITVLDVETGNKRRAFGAMASPRRRTGLNFAIAPLGRRLVIGGSQDDKSSQIEVWEFDDIEQTAKSTPITGAADTPVLQPDSISRPFPLRFKLASDMVDDLRQILLGRPGHEAKPSVDNQEILVIAPPDVMSRVQTFISVMDWPEGISRGPNFEYPRASVIEAARSFFYACAIEDNPEAFAKMLSLHVLAELKGDTKSENYQKHLFGGEPDPVWERSLRGDWPGKKDAIRRFVKEWNRYPLKFLKETGGVAIGFGAKHFCSVSFAGAPKEFYEITVSPDRTRGEGDKTVYVFNSLPPWQKSGKGNAGNKTDAGTGALTSGDPDRDDDLSPPPANKKLSFAVDLIPEKLQIMVGEPLWLDFKITNHANEELGLRVRRGWSAEPFVVEAAWDNDSLVTHNAASLRPADPRDVSYQTMTPESSTSLQLFLPDFHALKKPNEYRLTVRRPLEFSHLLRREGDRSWWDDKWDTVEVAATATIEVVPADRVRMGNVIEKLRCIVSDPKLGRDHPDIYRAVLSLRTIDDERTIPVFLELLKSKKLVDKERACRGLAKYGSDAALEGLKAALQTTLADFDEGNDGYPASIHECAVQALCQSPYPAASDFLLTLVNHPSEQVREIVLKQARELYLQKPRAKEIVDQFNAVGSDSPPGEDAKQDQTARDPLEGVWELVPSLAVPDKNPEEPRLYLVFSEGWHATYRCAQQISIRPYRVDRTQTPPHITLAGINPMRGIYDIKEDGLRLSLAPEAEAFPTKFGTEHAEFKRVTGNAVINPLIDMHVNSIRMLAQQKSQPTAGADAAPLFEQSQDGLKFSFKMNETRVAIDGKVLDGKVHNVVLRIGPGKHFWTSQIKNASSFQVVAEVSDKIKLEGGSLGSGLVFSVIQDGTMKSTSNIHIPATGPMLSGRLIFRESSEVNRDDRGIIFADLHTEDGKLIPVSISIDGKS